MLKGFVDVLDQQKAYKPERQAFQPRKAMAAEDILSDCIQRGKGDSADFIKSYLIKQVGSQDISPIRLISMAQETGLLRNQQTIFRNICESNPLERSTDFQIRIRERKVATSGVSGFPLDGTLPAVNQSSYFARTNTMQPYGNTINITFFATELAGQSPVDPTDLRAQQVEDEIVVMRRYSNSILLAQTEITDEGAANGPQMGGFVTRSTSYNTNLGGNQTNTSMQAQVDSIANVTSNRGLGYGVQLIQLTTAAQMANIRGLMIARYPGENSDAYLTTTMAMRQKFAGVAIPEAMWMVYAPNPGLPVLAIYEPQLPSGYTITFDPTKPRISKMQMLGQLGPFVVERPTSNLVNLLAVFDVESLVDPLVESRSVQTNVT